MIVASIAALPGLAACSGSIHPYHDSLSDFFSSSPTSQRAAALPPSSSYSAPTGQPAYAPAAVAGPATGQPADAAPGTPTNIAAVAAAPAPAPQPSAQHGTTVGSLKTSYVDFLNMFRDPSEQASEATVEEARRPPSGTPSTATARAAQPAATSRIAAAPAPHDPRDDVYPNVSLVDYFRGSASSQKSGAPHPPSTYAPASDATAASTTAAPSTPPSDGVHPSETIFDLFKSHSASSAPAPSAPHPPSTYTPVSQPGAAPAPSASDAAASAYPYPQESLSDIFSKKSGAQ